MNICYTLFGDNMKILFIRHGDPDYELDSLTPKGFREVELLADRMEKTPVTEFYCSPLGRAQATARPTLERLNKTAETLWWLEEFPSYILDPETKKRRIPWDLMPSYWTKREELYDKNTWLDSDVMQSGDVAIKYSAVTKAFDEFLARHGYERVGNLYRAVRPNTDTIAFFCHFGIESVLLSHLFGLSPIVFWQGFVALPSSVTTVITEEREEGIAYFRCNNFGDISHLYAANEPPSFSARFCETYSNMEERH